MHSRHPLICAVYITVAILTSCTTPERPSQGGRGDSPYANDQIAATGNKSIPRELINYFGVGTVTLNEPLALMMDFDGDGISELLTSKIVHGENGSLRRGHVSGNQLVWEDVPRPPDVDGACMNARFITPYTSAFVCINPVDVSQVNMLFKGANGLEWQEVPVKGLPPTLAERLSTPDSKFFNTLGYFVIPDAVSYLWFVDGEIWSETYVPQAGFSWDKVGQYYFAPLNPDMDRWTGKFGSSTPFDAVALYDRNTGQGWVSDGRANGIRLKAFQSAPADPGVPCRPCGRNNPTLSWTSRYKGDNPIDTIILYYESDHEWWEGTFLFGTLFWDRIAKSDQLANIGNSYHSIKLGHLWTEQNPSGQDKKEEILVYTNSTSDWNIAVPLSGVSRMLWRFLGNSRNIHGTPPFFNYKLFVGQFVPGAHEQILYYSIYPKNAWIGTVDDSLQLNWTQLAQ